MIPLLNIIGSHIVVQINKRWTWHPSTKTQTRVMILCVNVRETPGSDWLTITEYATKLQNNAKNCQVAAHTMTQSHALWWNIDEWSFSNTPRQYRYITRRQTQYVHPSSYECWCHTSGCSLSWHLKETWSDSPKKYRKHHTKAINMAPILV